MNVHAAPAGISLENSVLPAEWRARIDLAAVYRLVACHGWDDVIYNHFSTPSTKLNGTQ